MHYLLLLFIPLIAVAVIALLRRLFGTRVMRHIKAVCIGVIVGILFAFSVLLGPVSGNETVKHIFNFVNAPSTWALSLLPAYVWGLFHFTYWAFLFGLLSFGVAAILAKMTGNE